MDGFLPSQVIEDIKEGVIMTRRKYVEMDIRMEEDKMVYANGEKCMWLLRMELCRTGGSFGCKYVSLIQLVSG